MFVWFCRCTTHAEIHDAGSFSASRLVQFQIVATGRARESRYLVLEEPVCGRCMVPRTGSFRLTNDYFPSRPSCTQSPAEFQRFIVDTSRRFPPPPMTTRLATSDARRCRRLVLQHTLLALIENEPHPIKSVPGRSAAAGRVRHSYSPNHKKFLRQASSIHVL